LLAIIGDFFSFRLTARGRLGCELWTKREEWLQIVLRELSPSKGVHNPGTFFDRDAEDRHFPQVFAQVWKTLGGDQIPYAILEPRL